jgi:RNA polymerase sigma-70 factor, ECF subfamily
VFPESVDSDERLYERLRAGELAAFDALYARYERPLFGFVRAYLDDAHEAEDVLHEAFLGLLRNRPVDFSRGSFRGWLYQVARNACLNRLRSRSRGERAQRLVESAPADAGGRADEQLERVETMAALGQAVARLPPPLTEVYRLRASGLSYEEMSRVLDVPLGTVKSRMHELIAQLRKELQPWTAR